jgi:hypothetical protein
VGGDDPLAQLDVAQRVGDGGRRLEPGRHRLVEGEQLQLERVLVGDDLLAAPRPDRARIPALEGEPRRLVAQER